MKQLDYEITRDLRIRVVFGCLSTSFILLFLSFLCIIIHIKMDQAVAYKKQHPEATYSEVSNRFKVPSSTLNDHVRGTHDAPGVRTPRILSVHEEKVLVAKINSYADRGTLLRPKHIKELAKRISQREFHDNWTSEFLRRHQTDLSSRFFHIQELARIEADTPSNREAFFTLVSTIRSLIDIRTSPSSPSINIC